MMSFPTSGFQDKGATWVGEELYYFSNSTGIRFKPDATHPDTLLVVYPDGTLSAHSYIAATWPGPSIPAKRPPLPHFLKTM